MQYEPPTFGISSMSARKVLAANLAALMDAKPELKPVKAIEDATDGAVGKSTVARAKLGENAINIDNLEAIAHAFGLEAWQLLVPGLTPKNPPVLKSIGEAEDKLYARIGNLVREAAKLEEGK